MLVSPELAAGRDTRVRVDARAARPVSVSVPDRAAVGVMMVATYAPLLAGHPVVNAIGNPDTTAMFTAHEGPEAAGYTFEGVVSAYFARPGPDGSLKDSPVTYAAAWHQRGRFFAGFRKRAGRGRAGHGDPRHPRRAPWLVRLAAGHRRATSPRPAGQPRVERIMRQRSIVGLTRRRRRSLTKQDTAAAPAPDLIGRDFTAPAPGQRLVGDITYLPTQEGWLYLATTIDLFNREVVGHAMAEHMRAELVCDAVDLAHRRGLVEPGAIFHLG